MVEIIIRNGNCIDKETNRICENNGDVCDCSVYAGDVKKPNRFRSE